MNNLVLLPQVSTTEERIKNKIESFKKELLSLDGDIETVQSLLAIAADYLYQFEDPTVQQAYIKLNESIFWIDNFIHYE